MWASCFSKNKVQSIRLPTIRRSIQSSKPSLGLLIDGAWHNQWYDTKSTGGRFIRSDAQYRNWITKDGSPGPTGLGGYKAEKERYHLYVSLACPWAHRTIIMRKLKDLESIISVSVVNWLMLEQGWTFKSAPGVISDPINNADYLYQVFLVVLSVPKWRLLTGPFGERDLHARQPQVQRPSHGAGSFRQAGWFSPLVHLVSNLDSRRR